MLYRSRVPETLRRHAMQDLIKEFMAQKRFAVVGATTDTKKYGN